MRIPLIINGFDVLARKKTPIGRFPNIDWNTICSVTSEKLISAKEVSAKVVGNRSAEQRSALRSNNWVFFKNLPSHQNIMQDEKTELNLPMPFPIKYILAEFFYLSGGVRKV
jgi:hypothetical protein